MRWWCVSSVVVAGAIAPVAARAETMGFVGGVLRTDLGTHTGRVSLGVERGDLAATVVVDPYGYIEDSQHDTDALIEWAILPHRWSALAGYRFESNPLLGVRYQHEKLLVGIAAEMPHRLFGHVRFRMAAEIAFTVVEHGRELPSVWAWEHDEFFRNAFDLGLFLRAEWIGCL